MTCTEKSGKRVKKTRTIKDATGLSMSYNSARKFDADVRCRFSNVYGPRSPFAGEVSVDSKVCWNQLVQYYMQSMRRFGPSQSVDEAIALRPSYRNLFLLGAAIEQFIGLP